MVIAHAVCSKKKRNRNCNLLKQKPKIQSSKQEIAVPALTFPSRSHLGQPSTSAAPVAQTSSEGPDRTTGRSLVQTPGKHSPQTG